MWPVKNKTIIGLKLEIHLNISITCSVKNKTIIGLKFKLHGTIIFFERSR